MGRQNSRSALIEAYFATRAELIGYFALRLRSKAAAEDLVQDIYVRLSEIDPPQIKQPVAYLYRLGSNMMLDRMRSERRAAARDGAWRQTHTTSLHNDPIAEDPNAIDALAARQRLAAVISALKDLPPQTQRVFRMHKLDGRSHTEVAAALGISRSGVEKHMIAALKHLAERLP